ncbi:TIGR04104 family putative zinc finger protein [Planococcus donghaensis]|uniref:TIGR04104 family putative zinc finger protein n=1 Tax=Planococcus donghaensis TaxID=414778 RepID=UPI0037364FD4
MPICKSCGRRWTHKQSFKASWKIRGSMRCPHCGSDQYATAKSRQRLTLLNWIILLPLPFAAIFDLPMVYTTGMILVLFAVAMSLIPKSLELSNEHEPIW